MSLITGGLDEVGWGSLAGFLLSCVTVFHQEDLKFLPSKVTDSKRLSYRARESLFLPIQAAALDVGYGHAWPWEMDDLGPERALQLSYQRALMDLTYKPDLLYVDGVRKVSGWSGRQICEPKADSKYKEVSAASILAKVSRDRAMEDMDPMYPQYRWKSNKGYGTDDHSKAILHHGLVVGEKRPLTYVHRKCFCKNLINQGARLTTVRAYA